MFKRFVTGDRLRLPAALLNAWTDTAEAFAKGGGQGGRADAGGLYNPGVIPVKNDTGAAVDRFAVLGVADVVYDATDNADEFKTRPALVGDTPSVDTHKGRFVITLEPIDDGAVGLAVATGVVPCIVDMQTAGDTFADLDDGQVANLKSDTLIGAARILYVNAGTGDQWAIVQIGNTSDSVVPPGTITAFAGDTVPAGWLPCDGTAVSRTTYAALADALDAGGTGGDYLWGNGDGSTTFNVPDLKGQAIRGYDDGDDDYSTVGNTGGLRTLDLDHEHSAGGDVAGDPCLWPGSFHAWDYNYPSTSPDWTGAQTSPTVDRPDNSGDDNPHEVDNRGPFAVAQWIIKT